MSATELPIRTAPPPPPETVEFDTMRIEHPAGRRPARVRGTLHLPLSLAAPAPAMVILTSSAGVQRHREHYYAAELNAAGVAALVVDSFSGRGVRRTVADQSLVSAVQMEGDAFAALRVLRDDPRIDGARIGLMGVSKGGVATVNAAIAVRRAWRPDPALEFAAHIAICPGCTSQHRDARTTGRPMFLMLAAHDDYTPAALAIEYAERMRRAGPADIKVKVYGAAHHGWESIGPVFDLKHAENWSRCRNWIEDDGRHWPVAAGRAMDEAEYFAWAAANCVSFGARAGGGTPELKARATRDLVAFLRRSGF